MNHFQEKQATLQMVSYYPQRKKGMQNATPLEGFTTMEKLCLGEVG
jgi:hypothetical protein